MKILYPKLVCPECDNEEFVIRETVPHLYAVKENLEDAKRPLYDKGEELHNDENPVETVVQCAECYSDVTAPVDFFCPSCFDYAPITGQGGTMFRGSTLLDVGCMNALAAEIKYINGPWHGRILRTKDAVWMPFALASGRSRNMTRESVLARMLGVDCGKVYPEYLTVGIGKGEPWVHHSTDKDVILPIYGVRTDAGWYFVNSDHPDAEPTRMSKWEIVCNWIFRVPNIVVNDED